MKSNPIQPLLDTLAEQNCNFDCASKNEIETVLNMGVKAERVVFSNPVKNEMDLVWAQENGVLLTTADTLNELLKIKKFAPKMRILWRISIKEENPEQLSSVFSGKFGDDLSSYDQIYQRFIQI